ncbi:MAG: ATP--guanido phosphotransferase [Eubacteriales bacterium]
MSWYDHSGPEKDVFVSSRVRLARNLEDFPFEGKLSPEQAKEIIAAVRDAFPAGDAYKFIDMSKINDIEALSYYERHYISREFAVKKSPHALVLQDQTGLSLMICEEDHLRIQCLSGGLSLRECYKTVSETEAMLSRKLPFAFDEKWGYLTHCPTNLGTGMRVSVMMFLPAFTLLNRMEALSTQLQKVGLVIRGMGGEGSRASGSLYQISNQETMGITEDNTLRKVIDIVRQIAEQERKLRASFDKPMQIRLKDRAARAEGVLRHAEMVSSGECIPLYADLRLGLALGMSTDMDLVKLDKMIFEAMPATVSLQQSGRTDDKLPDEMQRDITRAQIIRKMITP